MKFSFLFVQLLLMVLPGCKSRNDAGGSDATHKEASTATVSKQPFDGIEFASKMDVACGMPLTAGVQDTARYNGKVYGFCSKDCKSEFLKTPESFLASKYRR